MGNSLYLFPADTSAAPAREAVKQALQRVDFIGAALPGDGYAVGGRFLQLVTFAGCSPHLVFEPPQPGSLAFCHVDLLGPYADLRMITGPHTSGPKCPGCGRRLVDWRERASPWLAHGDADWRCPACGHTAPVADWRWRHQAAFGRLLVAVREIFPSEGVPAEALLGALAEATAKPWHYAWAATVSR